MISMRKKLGSMLLAVALCVTMVPGTVFASDTGSTTTTQKYAGYKTGDLLTLQGAQIKEFAAERSMTFESGTYRGTTYNAIKLTTPDTLNQKSDAISNAGSEAAAENFWDYAGEGFLNSMDEGNGFLESIGKGLGTGLLGSAVDGAVASGKEYMNQQNKLTDIEFYYVFAAPKKKTNDTAFNQMAKQKPVYMKQLLLVNNRTDYLNTMREKFDYDSDLGLFYRPLDNGDYLLVSVYDIVTKNNQDYYRIFCFLYSNYDTAVKTIKNIEL